MKKIHKVKLPVPPGAAGWVTAEMEKQRQQGIDSIFVPVPVCIDGPGLDENMYDDPYGLVCDSDGPHEKKCDKKPATQPALHKRPDLRLV